jgi:hypothetical protein
MIIVQTLGGPMGITRGRRHRGGLRVAAGLVAAGMAAAVALTGCGADDGGDDASTGGFSGERADAPAAVPNAEVPAEGKAEGGAGAPVGEAAGAPARFQADQRSIIYNGSITVRMDDAGEVDAAAARAIAAVTAAGGFVGSDKRTSDNGRSQASLELRVPADRFTALVDDLAGLGEEEARAINTQDVTEEVVDLDARLATQQASVNRTRTLLAQARTIAEIVSVEGEMAKREAELASLQARKRRLADLTALSTITLTLLGPDVDVVAEDEPETGFVAGLKAGWKAFLVSMEVLLTVLGALLPWLIAVGVPIFAIVWLLRRLGRRARPAATATPGPPPAPPAA